MEQTTITLNGFVPLLEEVLEHIDGKLENIPNGSDLYRFMTGYRQAYVDLLEAFRDQLSNS